MWAVLGIGSNLGDRAAYIAAALDQLAQIKGTFIRKVSNIYETEPFDVQSEQPCYLNCCVRIETEHTPEDLLKDCQAIEQRLGRERREYHGARTMDIDLLLYEGFTSGTKHLTVPHPGILQRAFVLIPLHDLFPDGKADDFDFQTAFNSIDKSGVLLYNSSLK